MLMFGKIVNKKKWYCVLSGGKILGVKIKKNAYYEDMI